MKILVINPNTTQAMTDDIGEMALKYARRDTEIVAVSPPMGPRSIEGHFEDYLAAAATLEVVAENRDEFDAFVIACYGDPGLFACREITAKPVIGIAEASMHLATFLGHKFSVISVIPRVKPLLEDLVRFVGLETKCASVRCTSLTVLEIEADPERAVRELIVESRRAVEEDGAEAICLGCAGMGPLDKRIQEAVGVPVLDGTVCAVKLAEAFFDYGLSTSKVAAFAWPERKELVGCAAVLQAVANGAPNGR
jgi:allantoin racemase